jgi:ketosteroid isomerase-like protein
MISPEQAIGARRRLTNKLIAAKQADRLKPYFDPACHVIAGDGSVLVGREDVLAAFAAQFLDPGFGLYQRTSQSVTLDQAGNRAAEVGVWVAQGVGGQTQASGTYLACWRKVIGQWVIESELYITL